VAERLVRTDDFGTLRIDRDGFAEGRTRHAAAPSAAALQWVGGAEYRPRAAPLEACSTGRLLGGGGTLHGAQVEVTRDEIEVFREFAAVAGVEMPGPGPPCGTDRWKSRPADQGAAIRALGDDGWRQIPAVATTGPTAARHAIARDAAGGFRRGPSSWGVPRCTTVEAMSPSSARRWDIFLPC
jgi:tRNA(Ile)-lysidine synthase